MRWATVALLALVITACGAAAPAAIVTAIGAGPSPVGVATGKTALKGSSTVNASPVCVASLRPSGPPPAPGHMPAGSTMAAIYKRGHLTVGVDQTTPLLSYLDPATGRIDGFNVAIARQIAKAIFGNENAIKFVAITSAQRKSAILGHKVDLIADPTTIVCDRLAWADFSTDYLNVVRFVNAVLERMRRDGEWKRLYAHYIGIRIQPQIPDPPAPLYCHASCRD